MNDMRTNLSLHVVATLALSLTAFSGSAAPAPKSDTPADYAYALPLQVSGAQGVVAYTLPLSVYMKARTAVLDDLRVFDANGVAQPFALYRPSLESVAHRDSVVAAVFPVHAAPSTSGSAAVDLDMRTRADGSLLSVQAHAGKVPGSDEASLTSLMLDFGSPKSADNLPPRIEALRFKAPDGQSNYSAQVWLESSNDLKQWETIGAAELSWLANGEGQTLASDRLEFSPQSFRYARLSWRRGTPVEFAEIRAETITRTSREPERDTLWIKPVPGRQAGDLVYPAGIALPVEQVSLNLGEPNIIYPLALGGYVERPTRRGSKTTEWVFQARTRATFYQITQDGQTRRSGPLHIGSGHLAEWVIRPQNLAVTAQPELGLSWQPATLVFLAGGARPHTLNFGRDDAWSASQSLAQVAPGFKTEEIRQLEQAQAGELRSVLSDASGDSDAARAGLSARQRNYILWGVLLLGVVVLGGMAWRLVRQMKAGADKAGKDPEQ